MYLVIIYQYVQTLRGFVHGLPPSQFDKDDNQETDKNTEQIPLGGKGIADDVDEVEDELNEFKKKLENTTTHLTQTKKVSNHITYYFNTITMFKF